MDADQKRASIVRVIERLAVGEVVSYGDVAARARCPGNSRMVGMILSVSLDCLPWWRVVYNDGRLPPCNPTLQERLLSEEGVDVKGFRVRTAPVGRFAASIDVLAAEEP